LLASLDWRKLVSDNTNVSPAVLEAKARREEDVLDGILELTTGVRIRLGHVPPGILEDVAGRVQAPRVPNWFNPDKGVEEPNPNSPDYLAALAEYELKQAAAIMDAIALFGMDLVDGVPEDDSWIGKLKILSRRGGFDMSGYDLDDPIEREFLFKRYIALGNEDLMTIGKAVGTVTSHDIERARASFRDDETRAADRTGRSEEGD
jgi:hypothetical protein